MSHAGHVIPAPGGFVPHVVAPHFDSQEQEYQSAKLGFWLFLATEILLFGGLFAAFFYFKSMYTADFVRGGELLNWELGTLNTVILLVSSFTMAMAVRSAQLTKKGAMLRYLLLTFLLGAAFMVVKYVEYSAKVHHGFLPGVYFIPTEASLAEFSGLLDFPRLSMFFALYWTMTGIHGFHVLCGMVVIGWLIWRGRKGHFHENHYMPVDLVGLYWHIVDIIWIFLFPLLYLVP